MDSLNADSAHFSRFPLRYQFARVSFHSLKYLELLRRFCDNDKDAPKRWCASQATKSPPDIPRETGRNLPGILGPFLLN
jgi:hypothetical protein